MLFHAIFCSFVIFSLFLNTDAYFFGKLGSKELYLSMKGKGKNGTQFDKYNNPKPSLDGYFDMMDNIRRKYIDKAIEQLPSEMKEKFTKLRCLDLEAQNDQDKNQSRINELFQSASSMAPAERQRRYNEIKTSFSKILKSTDEKVEVSNSMYDLIERYQRQLDSEIGKFKLELEADSPGITEELERRARDHEQASRTQKKNDKRRKQKLQQMLGGVGLNGDQSPSPSNPMLHDTNYSESRLDIYPRSAAGGSGSGAQNSGPYMHFASNESRHGRPRKMTSRVQELLQGALSNKKRERDQWLASMEQQKNNSSQGDEDGGNTETEAERTWCICNQSSYGEMVACDNPSCAFEWFHYECVNITAPPKGRWFCPHCSATMKRRKLENT